LFCSAVTGVGTLSGVEDAMMSGLESVILGSAAMVRRSQRAMSSAVAESRVANVAAEMGVEERRSVARARLPL